MLTVMEHHSNLVPWQLLAQRTGCVLRFCGLTKQTQASSGRCSRRLRRAARQEGCGYPLASFVTHAATAFGFDC